MIFDDLFYPGNPKRRQEVANLRGEIIAIFKNYTTAWNNTAELLNNTFAQVKNPSYAGLTFRKLKNNIDFNSVGDCINEINDVISDTKDKLNKLVKDIGLDEVLPTDWKEKGCSIDQIGAENIQKIGRIVSGLACSAAAAFVGYYVFTGVTVAVMLASVISEAVTGLMTMLSGVFAGAILGGVAFVVTDIIASAITGAIERKKLNEAIDSLKELKNIVESPLTKATVALGGIIQNINNGNYRLDNEHILWKTADGRYIIVKIEENTLKAKNGEFTEQILFLCA